jgi:glycosyltransferase involved in cell wall biosynthesis
VESLPRTRAIAALAEARQDIDAAPAHASAASTPRYGATSVLEGARTRRPAGKPPAGCDGGVLHLVTSTQRRGAQVFAVDLAGELADLGLPGDVVALNDGGGLPVAWAGRGRFHPVTLRELRRRARRSGVVVAHGSATLLAAFQATRATSIPFVYRGIGEPDHWVSGALRRGRVGLMLRRAARVVALWPAARGRLIQRYALDERRVVTIPNGVRVRDFPLATPETRRSARAELGITNGGPVVSFVGSLTDEKDPLAAVRAVAAIDGTRLVVAGDGSLSPEVRVLADRLLPDRAHFLGPVGNVAPILTASDALVLPSRTEGLPGALIEAGFVGLPVVATDVGGVAEIVEDGATGALVSPGDDQALTRALARVLEEPFDGRRARDRCRALFGMEVVAEPWAQLLRSLCIESGRPAASHPSIAATTRCAS